MRELKILALDLGSNFGLATNVGPQNNIWSWHFEGDRPTRQAALITQFQSVMRTYARDLDVVVYERPFCRGKHATRSLWGMAGIIEGLTTAAGLPVLDQVPRPIKIWACGKPNASKEDMIAAAIRMGYNPKNEHEADAACLLEYAKVKIELGDTDG